MRENVSLFGRKVVLPRELPLPLPKLVNCQTRVRATKKSSKSERHREFSTIFRVFAFPITEQTLVDSIC